MNGSPNEPAPQIKNLLKIIVNIVTNKDHDYLINYLLIFNLKPPLRGTFLRGTSNIELAHKFFYTTLFDV